VMTRAATVVRYNNQLHDAYGKVCELHERVMRCSLADTGQWTNQNVVFTKALQDMFPLAKTIVKGALQRDECRGAHYKPDFEMPGIDAEDPPSGRSRPSAGATRSSRTTASGSSRRSPGGTTTSRC
jgi:succinate dehydrogenase / fumarate reductase, flavoprotein subunit